MLAVSPRRRQTVPAPRSLLRFPSSHAAPEPSCGFACIPPAHSCSPSRRVAARRSTSEGWSHQCQHPDGCPPHRGFLSGSLPAYARSRSPCPLATQRPMGQTWRERKPLPLPRTRERTAKKRRLSVHASQQIHRDRPEYRRPRRSGVQAGWKRAPLPASRTERCATRHTTRRRQR